MATFRNSELHFSEHVGVIKHESKEGVTLRIQEPYNKRFATLEMSWEEWGNMLWTTFDNAFPTTEQPVQVIGEKNSEEKPSTYVEVKEDKNGLGIVH